MCPGHGVPEMVTPTVRTRYVKRNHNAAPGAWRHGDTGPYIFGDTGPKPGFYRGNTEVPVVGNTLQVSNRDSAPSISFDWIWIKIYLAQFHFFFNLFLTSTKFQSIFHHSFIIFKARIYSRTSFDCQNSSLFRDGINRLNCGSHSSIRRICHSGLLSCVFYVCAMRACMIVWFMVYMIGATYDYVTIFQ